MRAWVTDCPNFLSQRVIPMKFRYHSAMMGTLGIGCNILKFSDDEVRLSQEMVQEYKEIRHIIQEGKFFRIENTSQNDYYLYQYLKEDEGVLFMFLPQSQLGHRGIRVKFRGLVPEKTYVLETPYGSVKKSGSYLMDHGLEQRLVGDYASRIIKFKAE